MYRQNLPFKKTLFVAIWGLIIVMPVLLWTASQSWPGLANPSAALRSIGQLCGLIGATLFSLNFILSARLKWIEELLNGLPRIYNLHHLSGGIAWILLLTHPVFLGLQYVPYSISAAASFYIPSLNNIPKLFGAAALGTLSILLFITFFIRIAYHHWKSTHQWLGLALVFASLHVYLIPGHLDSTPWLRGYMVTIIVAGLVAFGYRVLFGRWLVRRYSYIVETVKVHPKLATEVRLLPVAKPVVHAAGQFFFLRVHADQGISREPHPFSFTSNPSQAGVSFASKMAGDYTSQLLPKLRKGARVDIEGPYGRFLFVRGAMNQVWVAGGIGITPFMSRVREMKQINQGSIHLYYVVKSRTEALFVDELLAVANKVEHFSVTVWESGAQGKFSVEQMSETLPDGADYFICGPAGLMAGLKLQLQAAGVAKRQIITEEFKLY